MILPEEIQVVVLMPMKVKNEANTGIENFLEYRVKYTQFSTKSNPLALKFPLFTHYLPLVLHRILCVAIQSGSTVGAETSDISRKLSNEH